jgi:hypothetical protein
MIAAFVAVLGLFYYTVVYSLWLAEAAPYHFALLVLLSLSNLVRAADFNVGGECLGSSCSLVSTTLLRESFGGSFISSGIVPWCAFGLVVISFLIVVALNWESSDRYTKLDLHTRTVLRRLKIDEPEFGPNGFMQLRDANKPQGDEDNLIYRGPDVHIGAYWRRLVRAAKAKFLNVGHDSPAQRAVVRKWMYQVAVAQGVRIHHICSCIDLAVSLVFIPSKSQLEAAAVERLLSVTALKEAAAEGILYPDLPELGALGSLRNAKQGFLPA